MEKEKSTCQEMAFSCRQGSPSQPVISKHKNSLRDKNLRGPLTDPISSRGISRWILSTFSRVRKGSLKIFHIGRPAHVMPDVTSVYNFAADHQRWMARCRSANYSGHPNHTR